MRMSTQSPTSRKVYVNEEPLRECHYCGSVHPGRGMYTHVKLSGDIFHGPSRELPEDFDIEDHEVVGTKKVRVNRARGYQDDHSRWVCNVCGDVFKGKTGLGVHLRKSSDPYHRSAIDRGEEIDYSQHNVFPATADGEIIVPSDEWVGPIKEDLSEDEGFEVVVNREKLPLKEVIEVQDAINGKELTDMEKKELLEAVRNTFRKRMMESPDPDFWIEAYQEVEDTFEESDAGEQVVA